MSEIGEPLGPNDGQRAVREAQIMLGLASDGPTEPKVPEASTELVELKERALRRFLKGTHNTQLEIALRNLRALKWVLSDMPLLRLNPSKKKQEKGQKRFTREAYSRNPTSLPSS